MNTHNNFRIIILKNNHNEKSTLHSLVFINGIYGCFRNWKNPETPSVNENENNVSKKLLLDYYGPQEII